MRYIELTAFLHGVAQVVAEPSYAATYHCLGQRGQKIGHILGGTLGVINIESEYQRQALKSIISHPYYREGFETWLIDPSSFQQMCCNRPVSEPLTMRTRTRESSTELAAESSNRSKSSTTGTNELSAASSTDTEPNSLLAYLNMTDTGALSTGHYLSFGKYHDVKENEEEDNDETSE